MKRFSTDTDSWRGRGESSDTDRQAVDVHSELGGLRYLSGSHFAEDVPEAEGLISGSGHDGLSVWGHGLEHTHTHSQMLHVEYGNSM